MHATDTVLLNNSRLQIAVSRVGAELQSLKSRVSDDEYLWQGDPAVWGGRAPILFPIVGSLKNNLTQIGQQNYELPRHGLVRRKSFSLLEQKSDQCSFSIQSDESTLASYPWQFELRVSYALQDQRLKIHYEVFNRDSSTMIFTLGSHPGFTLPEPVSEYSIRFSQPETLQRFPLDTDGLLAVKGTDYLDNSDTLPLSADLFNDDALVFKDIKSQTIDLLHKDRVRVSVDTGATPHLGLWAKPGAPFVCIEPWFGYSDSLDTNSNFCDKPAMLHLPAGECFSHHWSVLIPDAG